jgi:hypothetical protein
MEIGPAITHWERDLAYGSAKIAAFGWEWQGTPHADRSTTGGSMTNSKGSPVFIGDEGP